MDSAENNKYNLTNGGILKKLFLVAVPIMGTNFMQMAYNLTDMFWLGRVGRDAVAAVGAAGMYLWLSFGFMLIGRMGAEIGVSQHLGKGDRKSALAFSQNAMIIAAALGLLFGSAMIFFNRYLIGFFNFQEKEVAALGAEYLFITGFPMPLVFVSFVMSGTFNASGNSRTPFIINGLGLAMNVILDPIFVLVLGMGVRGAALATAISEILAVTAMIAALLSSKNRPFERFSLRLKPDPEKVIRIFKWALPIGLESILFCFLTMMCSRIEATFGADAIAVSKVGVQFEALSWLVGGGFGSALVAFTGQNYGAEKWERIHQGTKIAAGIMALWGTLITALFLILGEALFSLFLPSPELIALGKRYLFILAFSQLAMNLETVAAGAFKGTGRTIPPSLASTICNMARPPLAYLLSRTSLGLYGIWLAVTICSVVRGVWICVWYAAAEKRRVTSQHRSG